MTESKTVTFDDGEEYEVVRESGEVSVRKSYEQRKRDLLSNAEPHPHIAEADVDYDVLDDLAERKDNDVGTVLVSPSLLQEWAERVHRESDSDRTVTLTVTDNLPLVAELSSGKQICVAPRKDNESDATRPTPDREHGGVRRNE